MQPYLFPYIGYYQLIHAVDSFVVYDDVNFIKGGWINRNSILSNGKPTLFRVPLVKASQNKKIYEIRVNPDPKWYAKLGKTFEQSYRKAAYFAEAFPLIRATFRDSYETIDAMAFQSLKTVSDFLNIDTQFIRTSRIYNNQHLKGQHRIIDICQREGAETYINASGGRALYYPAAFDEAEIKLYFLQSTVCRYEQPSKSFYPNLSIIDVLMHIGRKQTQRLLNNYVLQR